MQNPADIATIVRQLEETTQRLDALLLTACPGPHKFIQHRDNRPPWCNTCRYQINGQPVGPPQNQGRTP